MNNLIKQLAKLPKKRLPLRADFNLRAKLYKVIWQKRLAGFRQLIRLRRLKPVPATVIILLCLFIIVPGYAYASDQVTRNHPLYPLKQGIEKVELSLALSAPAKAKTYTKLADRRLAEAEVISQQKDSNTYNEILIETIEEAVQLSDEADKEALNIPEEPARIQTQVKINRVKENQADTLANIAKTVGISAEETVLDSIALALEAIKPTKQPKDKEKKQRSDKIFNTLPKAEPASSTKATQEDEKKDKTISPTYFLPGPTSTVIAQPADKKQKIKYRHETALESINELKDKLRDLKTDITDEEYEPTDIATLFDRLDKRLEKAQESANSNRWNGFDNIIKSTDALTNNAKHFLKSRNRQDKNKMKNFWPTRDNDEEDEDSGEWDKNGKKSNNKWNN